MEKHRNRTVVLAVTGMWLAFGLFSTVQMLGMEVPGGTVIPARHAFITSMMSAALWIPPTLVLLWLVGRISFERAGIGRLLVALAAFSAFVAFTIMFRAVAVILLNPWVGFYQELPPFGGLLVTSVNNNFLKAWLLVGVAHAWLFARRAREREQQSRQLQAMLVQARLDALSAQLNPHFLFNALNSIAEMVHRDADAADRMLVALGELLRASLEYRENQWVTMRDELALLGHYLDIERNRLGDRLQVEWRIDPRAEAVQVPPLLLQPLAENAVVHALSLRSASGQLLIDARIEGDELRVGVSDDGGQRPSWPRHGQGLANLRARLEYLYGRGEWLRLLPNAEGGMTADLRLPISMRPSADGIVAAAHA